MDRKELRGSLCLLLTAVIWGAAFVAQSVSMDYVGPFTFQCVRSLLASLVLLPVALLLRARRRRRGEEPAGDGKGRGTLWKAGLICGLIMTVATNLQQVGMQYTTPGKAGFITALYIVLVPLLGLFRGRRPSLRLWLCVALALVGLWLLSMTGGFALSTGDLLVLLCAVAFSFHILAVDRFAPLVDGVALSCIQFLVTGVLSGVLMLLFESPRLPAIGQAAVPILYAGIMSCGVAYTLQIIGQKYARPTVASLLMSLESVFALLTGMVILNQIPTPREAVGCAVMLAAIVLAQLPEKAGHRAQ